MSAASKPHAALLRPGPTARVVATAAGGALFSASRPPKAPPPRKASHAAECERLEQLPNIGPSLAVDLRDLGIAHPRELAGKDAFTLYHQLCTLRGTRQDPCVLDTFMAAVDFMRGARPRPWWTYTTDRKLRYGAV